MTYKIHKFDTLASTNDTAGDGSYSHCDVVVADYQSDGRGQRGNHWESAVGENLTFTLVVEPTHIRVTEQYRLSMMAAVAVSKTLTNYNINNVEIKWPNDILVRGKKISGILIEHSFSSEYLSRTIIGIGINVAQRNFSAGAGNPTSIHLEANSKITKEKVLEDFLTNFSECYSMNLENLMKEYRSRLYRKDGYHLYKDCKTGEQFSATITAINPDLGYITLSRADNTSCEYYFKEIAFI